MDTLNTFEFNYEWYDAASWGVTDFYDAFREQLIQALESGLDFNTGWQSVKKEIRSFCIVREGYEVLVSVSESMDEGVDLLDDAFWAAAKTSIDSYVKERSEDGKWDEESAEILMDVQEEDVCDTFADYWTDRLVGFCEQSTKYEDICEPTLEAIVETLSRLEGECSKELEEEFDDLVSNVREIFFANTGEK